MKTEVGDWDGANNLTMGMYSCIILACMCLARMGQKNTWVIFVLSLSIAFSSDDVISRFVFQTTSFVYTDWFLLPIFILICIYQTYKRVIYASSSKTTSAR